MVKVIFVIIIIMIQFVSGVEDRSLQYRVQTDNNIIMCVTHREPNVKFDVGPDWYFLSCIWYDPRPDWITISSELTG